MGIARFPKALYEAGFKVGLLCAPDSFISKTRYVEQKRFLREYKPSITLFNSLAKDLSKAIEEFAPKLVLPGDERAVYCLHQITRLAEKGQLKFISSETLAVIKFSLCDPTFYTATNNKNDAQALAKSLGISVPKQFVICHQEEAIAAANQLNYPVVLKKGVGEAGLGVKICQTKEQLLDCLNLPLFRQPSRYKQILRKLLGREISWIPNNSAMALQQYIVGTPSIHCVAALKGKILASWTVIKEGVNATGQATRIRFVERPEMAAAVAKFVAHIGYTGFADFDFLIDAITDMPYFIECNPRPSPIFHLGKTIGIDLAQAMFAGLANQRYAALPRLNEHQPIALFPQEWLRDPHSAYLKSPFHDIPWDDPLLLRAYLQQH